MKGGKREGAGRKPDPNKKRQVTFKLRPALIERLKQEPNQSRAIEKAIMEYFKMDKLDEGAT